MTLDKLVTFLRFTVIAVALWPVAAVDAQVTFEDVTNVMELEGSGAWIDIDRDDWIDLAPAWLNEDGRRFVSTGLGDGGAAWADVDNDGYMDSFTFAGGAIGFGSGEGSFTGMRLPERPHGVSDGGTFLDIDNDGLIDVWWGGYENFPTVGGYPDGIYRNLGDRTFQRLHVVGPPRSSRGVTSCDFDQDSDIDVYVTNYRLQANQLWINDGAGNFADRADAYNAAGGSGHGIGSAWGDFDNDGLIDLFAGNFAHPGQPQSRFLRNRGPEHGFHFEDMGQCGVAFRESYGSPAFGDFDNDGDLDLFFTTVYGGDQAVLYRNDSSAHGNWTFTDVTGPVGLGDIRKTYQASWGDFDNDGDLDLATAGRLYRNSGTTNHWLKIRLIGDARTNMPQPVQGPSTAARVNRAAIGAQVRITIDDMTLTRQVESSTGRGNMNEQTLHFGLGDHADPVDVMITWPNGIEQRETIEVDRMITIGVSFSGEPVELTGATDGTVATLGNAESRGTASTDGRFAAYAVLDDAGGSTIRIRKLPDAVATDPNAPRNTWDLSADFSLGANPNGAWSYLHMIHHRKTVGENPSSEDHNPPDTSAAALLQTTHTHAPGNGKGGAIDSWNPTTDEDPYAYFGIVGMNQPSQAPYYVPFTAGEICAHPGGQFRGGNRSTIVIARWTAPRDGEIVTIGEFRGAGDSDRDFYLIRNKKEILVNEHSFRYSERPFNFTLPVQAGDTLDLCIGRGARVPSSLAKVAQAIYYAGHEPREQPGKYLPVDADHDVTIDTSDGESFTAPIWSPIGPVLVCTGSMAGSERQDIYLIDLQTGGRRCLTSIHPGTSRNPIWTADGTAIVYENNQFGVYKHFRLARHAD